MMNNDVRQSKIGLQDVANGFRVLLKDLGCRSKSMDHYISSNLWL